VDDVISTFNFKLNEATGKYYTTAEYARALAKATFLSEGDVKTYNEWMAKINKQEREDTLDSIMQDIIPKRTELTE